jgi:hypothetical protein
MLVVALLFIAGVLSVCIFMMLFGTSASTLDGLISNIVLSRGYIMGLPG